MTEGDNRTYDPKDYVENSPFVRLIKTPTSVKLLDVFLRNHFQELTASELTKYADVNQSSISRNIDQLVEEGIVEKTRTNEDGQHYQLNKDNPAAKGFAQAQAELFSSFDEEVKFAGESNAGGKAIYCDVQLSPKCGSSKSTK